MRHKVAEYAGDDKILRMFPKQRNIPEKKPPSFILYPFELKAKMEEPYETKQAESLELIKNHLQHFKKCFVASSHGKDSLVLVHLIHTACKQLGIPMIDVFLNNTLNIYREEKTFWEKFNKWLGIEDNFKVFIPPKDKNGKQYTVWSIAEEYGHLPEFRRTNSDKRQNADGTPECCSILKKASVKSFLKSLPKDQRYDCHFIGTRAEESRIRKLGVLQRCRSYEIISRFPYPIRAVTPLSFWTKTDIYMYYSEHNMPMNPAYKIHNMDRMGCASCPAHKNWEIRLATDPTAEGFGMLKKNLEILSRTEPDRLVESVNLLRKYLSSSKSIHLGPLSFKLLSTLVKTYHKDFTTLDDFAT